MATKQARMHGRVEGAQARCAVPGCGAPGEFKAPLQPANFDGPGAWRFLCLDHVREHNAKYNFFDGHEPRGDHRGAVAARRLGPAEPQVRRQRRRPAARRGAISPIRSMRSRTRFGRSRATPQPSRFSKAERQRAVACSASARTPTATSCASAIRPGPPLSPGQERRRPQPRGQARRGDRGLSAAAKVARAFA